MDLQSQWTEQQAAQLSICAHKLFLSFVYCCSHISDAPTRLKKELDSVLKLQADLDSSKHALQHACTTLEKDEGATQTLDTLNSLECMHSHLLDKIEVLYSSLNVQDKFPELEGVGLDFMQILLLVRTSKSTFTRG